MLLGYIVAVFSIAFPSHAAAICKKRLSMHPLCAWRDPALPQHGQCMCPHADDDLHFDSDLAFVRALRGASGTRPASSAANTMINTCCAVQTVNIWSQRHVADTCDTANCTPSPTTDDPTNPNSVFAIRDVTSLFYHELLVSARASHRPRFSASIHHDPQQEQESASSRLCAPRGPLLSFSPFLAIPPQPLDPSQTGVNFTDLGEKINVAPSKDAVFTASEDFPDPINPSDGVGSDAVWPNTEVTIVLTAKSGGTNAPGVDARYNGASLATAAVIGQAVYGSGGEACGGNSVIGCSATAWLAKCPPKVRL